MVVEDTSCDVRLRSPAGDWRYPLLHRGVREILVAALALLRSPWTTASTAADLGRIRRGLAGSMEQIALVPTRTRRVFALNGDDCALPTLTVSVCSATGGSSGICRQCPATDRKVPRTPRYRAPPSLLAVPAVATSWRPCADNFNAGGSLSINGRIALTLFCWPASVKSGGRKIKSQRSPVNLRNRVTTPAIANSAPGEG